MMFSLSESTRINISLCLSIVLVIAQVLTVTALIILLKAYADLKKKATDCQKSLASIEAQTSRTAEGGIEPESTTVTLESETNKKWLKDGEESPIRVPTPRPGHRRSGFDQENPAHRTQSSISQEWPGFPRDTSFASARSRDSGTGSITTRTPKSSFSHIPKMGREDPHPERESPVESRSTSWNERRNQNEDAGSRSSRSQTMAIEMIVFEDNDGFENEGCTGDNENFTTTTNKPTLESEELMCNSNRNADNKEVLKKKWHRDEPEDSPTRVPTPPSNRKRKQVENEVQDSRSSRLPTMGIEMIGTKENERWCNDGKESSASTKVPTNPSKKGLKVNQNELTDNRSHRSQTMAIEMIGLEKYERKDKRASGRLHQRNETIDEASSILENDKTDDTRF